MPLPPYVRGVRRRRWVVPAGASVAMALIVAAVLAAVAATGDPAVPASAPSSPTTARPPVVSTTIPPSTTSAVPAAWPFAHLLDSVWAATPGGCLRVGAGDRVLYEANPDVPVVPASVTKLFTAAASLRVLGEGHRLRTVVRAMTGPVEGVIAGDLWLVGGGDPVLGTDGWAAQLDGDERLYTSLDELADQVVAAGVRRIDGRVLGDESRYDADRYVDSWPDRLVTDGEAGPLSALSVNDGFRTWGHPGEPFADPPADAAAIFTALLGARGVSTGGIAGAGNAPTSGIEIAGIDSPPIGELAHAMLRDSDNGTAELLVKELGRHRTGQGTTTAGTRTITQVLRNESVAMNGVTIADGSGLSDLARVTCGSLTSLLSRESAALRGRLAIGGRSGTLARRFLGTPAAGRLEAKTGSLNGTAAIAGYVDTATGVTVEFAYIINGLPPGESGRALQDHLAAALATASP